MQVDHDPGSCLRPGTDPTSKSTAMSHPRRVLLIDDNRTFLKHARRFLSKFDGIKVVGGLVDPTRALTVARVLAPDVFVIDLTMPGISGLELVPQLRQTCPLARIIILSSHDEAEYRDAALKAGAHAFVQKSRMAEDLPRAISDRQADAVEA